ncbi:MAG: flippase [Patescibacteria group bacterium]|nr:flippase [Patescibacteria group bacterium]
MTEIKKIAHNTIIQLLGKTITVAMALIGFGAMTRYLGQEGFGYYTTIYGFLAVFGILVDLGLQMTTTQLISDPNENESEILSNALSLRLVASLIFLGIAPLVIIFFPYPTIIKAGTIVAAIGFVFSSLVSTLTSYFQKHLIMHKLAIAEVVAKIIYLAGILLAIYFNLGLIAVIAAITLDSLLTLAILLYFADKKIKLKFEINQTVWKKILSQTWPIALTIALNLIYFKGDIIIMSLTRTQAEVGLYGAPYRVLDVLINTVYIFLGLILPILATAVAIKDFNKLKTTIQSAFDFLMMLAIPMVVGGYFLGRPLMALIAGADFIISGDIIKILLIATATIFIASLFGYAVVALNAQKQMIKFYFINAVVSIIGYLIFIPRYSYWGAAWMTVFTEGFILVTASYVLYKKISFLPKINLVAKIIVAAAVMGGTLAYFPTINLAASIVIGAAVYGLMLVLLGAINKKLVAEIISIK